jgi:hypothetical protein
MAQKAAVPHAPAGSHAAPSAAQPLFPTNPMLMNSTLIPAAIETNPSPSHDEIAQCARQLWTESGQPEGRDQAIWYEAERLLASGRQAPLATATAPQAAVAPAPKAAISPPPQAVVSRPAPAPMPDKKDRRFGRQQKHVM